MWPIGLGRAHICVDFVRRTRVRDQSGAARIFHPKISTTKACDDMMMSPIKELYRNGGKDLFTFSAVNLG